MKGFLSFCINETIVQLVEKHFTYLQPVHAFLGLIDFKNSTCCTYKSTFSSYCMYEYDISRMIETLFCCV